MPSAKLHHVQPFPGLFSSFFFFFCNWKWNLGTGKLENSNRQTKQQLVNMPGAVIEEWWEQRLLYLWSSWDIMCDAIGWKSVLHQSIEHRD